MNQTTLLVLRAALLLSALIGSPSVCSRLSAEPRTEPDTVRIAVVVHSSNPVESLTEGELERIFLRKSLKWDHGETITVFERPAETTIRNQFSRHVLHKTPSELVEYWLNLKLTRGLSAPKVTRSPRLLKLLLKRKRGGIGYLYEGDVDDTVKVITTLEVRADDEIVD